MQKDSVVSLTPMCLYHKHKDLCTSRRVASVRDPKDPMTPPPPNASGHASRAVSRAAEALLAKRRSFCEAESGKVSSNTRHTALQQLPALRRAL